jgi:NitT/TauT family transport system permease protein
VADTLTRATHAVADASRSLTRRSGGRPGAADAPAEGTGRGRGRRPSPLLDVRSDLSERARWLLAAAGLAAVGALWLWAASRGGETNMVPSPGETVQALRRQWQEGNLWGDFTASGTRILWGYAISMVLGVVFGVLIGSLRSAEAALEAPIGFMR